MIVAEKKRKENISEYLLYMFQIEDMIRAYEFDIDRIDRELISNYEQPYNIKRDIREWYASLITMMKENNLIKSGHIPLLTSLITDLNNLHHSLLSKEDEKDYKDLYSLAKPPIEELKQKSQQKETTDIEACLNGLYGVLLLRLQKKNLSGGTAEAISRISHLLAELTIRFHQVERGEKEL